MPRTKYFLKGTFIRSLDNGTGSLDDLLKVKIEPYRAINYSMLHNDRDIFQTFSISKLRTAESLLRTPAVSLCI